MNVMPMLSLVPALSLLAATAHASAPVPLNQATAADLAALDGIADGTAQRIVALRAERGRLGSVEALRILDLSEAELNALRDGTVIDLAVRRGGGKNYRTVDDVLAEFGGEPDVRAVQAMAMTYTKTRPQLVDGWLTAAKVANLLPSTTLTYRKELDAYARDEFEYLSDAEGRSDVDSQERVPNYVVGENDDTYQVSLRWRFDKIVMSSEQIRVISEAQDVVKLRDKVLDEVTRLYFDRRRLQVDLILNPPGDLRKQMEDELRLQELTANIDALTGGAFSAALPSG